MGEERVGEGGREAVSWTVAWEDTWGREETDMEN